MRYYCYLEWFEFPFGSHGSNSLLVLLEFPPQLGNPFSLTLSLLEGVQHEELWLLFLLLWPTVEAREESNKDSYCHILLYKLMMVKMVE